MINIVPSFPLITASLEPSNLPLHLVRTVQEHGYDLAACSWGLALLFKFLLTFLL